LNSRKLLRSAELLTDIFLVKGGGAIYNTGVLGAGFLTVKYAHFTSNTANISVGIKQLFQPACSHRHFLYPAHGWNRNSSMDTSVTVPQRPEPLDAQSCLWRKGAAIYLDKDGVASILMGIFNGNGAESSNSSMAYVAPGGRALFYNTSAFDASQGTLFEVQGSGTLLLDGGVFPQGDGASFGKLAFGALFLLRNMPEYSPSDLQIIDSRGTSFVPLGLCPLRTLQTNWWKVLNTTKAALNTSSALKGDSDPCFSCSYDEINTHGGKCDPSNRKPAPSCHRFLEGTVPWGVSCNRTCPPNMQPITNSHEKSADSHS
jgi:hypothetical protein